MHWKQATWSSFSFFAFPIASRGGHSAHRRNRSRFLYQNSHLVGDLVHDDRCQVPLVRRSSSRSFGLNFKNFEITVLHPRLGDSRLQQRFSSCPRGQPHDIQVNWSPHNLITLCFRSELNGPAHWNCWILWAFRLILWRNSSKGFLWKNQSKRVRSTLNWEFELRIFWITPPKWTKLTEKLRKQKLFCLPLQYIEIHPVCVSHSFNGLLYRSTRWSTDLTARSNHPFWP